MNVTDPTGEIRRAIGFSVAALGLVVLLGGTPGSAHAASPELVKPEKKGLLFKKKSVRLSSTGPLRLRSNAKTLLRFRVPSGWKGSRVGLSLPASRSSSRGISIKRVSVRWKGRTPVRATATRSGKEVRSGKVSRGIPISLDLTPLFRPGQTVDLRISLLGGKSPRFRRLPNLVRLPSGLGAGSTATIAATGDISCHPGSKDWNGGRGTKDACRQADVARLVRPSDDAILLLGDVDQTEGTLTQFRSGFDRSWGHLSDRFRPTPGNHEYRTPDAAGYFEYFGGLGVETGGIGSGYYSFDLGAWRVLSVNSRCKFVPCGAGSKQEVWFRAELEAARSQGKCTLAFWHYPVASGGAFGDTEAVLPLWQAFHELGGDVLLTGHDHNYQRFGPLDAKVRPSGDGPLSWVVGTGGRSHRNATYRAGAESLITGRFGILRMHLHDDYFGWKWVGLTGSQRDAGTAPCRA